MTLLKLAKGLYHNAKNIRFSMLKGIKLFLTFLINKYLGSYWFSNSLVCINSA